ncbi:MAG: creatininase family protein [Chloroflexi bacterium]|nr:creatininase family protein [Chloroflexota bacterium]
MILTSKDSAWDFKENPPHVAILPLACLEPHGTHLPVGTDQFIVTEIAQQAAELLSFQTFLLPTWPLGLSMQHTGQAGTFSLGFETLWAVVRDIVLALHEHDIHHVAIINNHGSPTTSTARPIGNFIVKTAVRQLNYETPGLTAIWVQPFSAGREALKELFSSADQDIHAGAIETSILMHLTPVLVGPLPHDHAPEFRSVWMDNTHSFPIAPDEIWGKPGESTAEKGKQALDAVVNATVEYIEHSFTQLDQIKGSLSNDRT